MDSIHKGLSEAKVNYSKCLRSLEVISDDIHQKRKDKKMLAVLANLQEREAGVGADSEDEASLDQSQLDLDLDCNSSLCEVDGMAPQYLPDLPPLTGRGTHQSAASGEEGPSGASASADGAVVKLGNMSLKGSLERSVSGAESSDSVDSDLHGSFDRTGSLKREVYGCEQGENEAEAGECSNKDVQPKGTEQIAEVPKTIGETTAVRSDTSENTTVSPKADSSNVQENESIARESEETGSSVSEATQGVHEQSESVETKDDGVDITGDEVIDETQTLASDISASNENTQNQEPTGSDCESFKASDDDVLETGDNEQVLPSELQTDNNNADQSESRDDSAESAVNESGKNGEWI